MLNVNMKPSRIRVKEVVVVGFGTQAREKVTSSITKLPAEALKNVPYAMLLLPCKEMYPGYKCKVHRSTRCGSANHCARRYLY